MSTVVKIMSAISAFLSTADTGLFLAIVYYFYQGIIKFVKRLPINQRNIKFHYNLFSKVPVKLGNGNHDFVTCYSKLTRLLHLS